MTWGLVWNLVQIILYFLYPKDECIKYENNEDPECEGLTKSYYNSKYSSNDTTKKLIYQENISENCTYENASMNTQDPESVESFLSKCNSKSEYYRIEKTLICYT